MLKTLWLRRRPAGSPEASLSTRSCLRLPQAPAGLGQSAACAALTLNPNPNQASTSAQSRPSLCSTYSPPLLPRSALPARSGSRSNPRCACPPCPRGRRCSPGRAAWSAAEQPSRARVVADVSDPVAAGLNEPYLSAGPLPGPLLAPQRVFSLLSGLAPEAREM